MASMAKKAAASVAFASMMATAPMPSSASWDSLASYRWNSRVLVLAAANPSNPRLAEQRKALSTVERGRNDRDLVILEAVGNGATAEALRRRLGVSSDAFRAVLVGKDGGIKLSSGDPIPSKTLFATIDAMPMRREEMLRR